MNKKIIVESIVGIIVMAIIISIVSCAACKKRTSSAENGETSSEKLVETNSSKIEDETDDTTPHDATTKVDETNDEIIDSEIVEEETVGSETTSNNIEETKTSEEVTTSKEEYSKDVENQTTSKENTTTTSNRNEDEEETSVVTENDNEVSDKTTAEVVKEMGIGINLGNTFESCGDWINASAVKNFETGWGSPEITKEMIQGIAKEGFGVLRIPVAWSNMMDSNYNIDERYINRVKEVADWAIDSGMYVIVNIHWDGGWFEGFSTNKSECMKKYKAIWTQLAEAFKEYDEKLVLESLNEEGYWDDVWNRYSGTATGKSKAYGILNEINQSFVDIIRSSGGNNVKRHLLIAGYNTDIVLTCDSYFVMPNDPAGRCAVSVHYYTPFAYTHLKEDTDWAKVQTEWGSEGDIKELNKYMKMMYDTFVSKGIPVIIGEFGVAEMSNKDKDNAVYYMSMVAKVAYDYGMCPVLWDTTNQYSFYNRYNCCMSEYPTLKEAFLNILK